MATQIQIQNTIKAMTKYNVCNTVNLFDLIFKPQLQTIVDKNTTKKAYVVRVYADGRFVRRHVTLLD